MTSSTLRATCALLVAFAATGACARPRPATAPPPPALEVPVVPPRVIAALPEEEPPEEATQAEPERPRTQRPPRPRPKPPAPAPETAQKPDAVPETPPEVPKTAEPAAGTVLRTPQTVDEPEAARRVRLSLARASEQLGRVNVGGLNSDAKAQYDTARRFIDQAEGALKARNYMFAAYLADKAETLARGLGGR